MGTESIGKQKRTRSQGEGWKSFVSIYFSAKSLLMLLWLVASLIILPIVLPPMPPPPSLLLFVPVAIIVVLAILAFVPPCDAHSITSSYYSFILGVGIYRDRYSNCEDRVRAHHGFMDSGVICTGALILESTIHLKIKIFGQLLLGINFRLEMESRKGIWTMGNLAVSGTAPIVPYRINEKTKNSKEIEEENLLIY